MKHSSLGDQNIILYWGEKELGPNWELEEMVLKNREGDKGREWDLMDERRMEEEDRHGERIGGKRIRESKERELRGTDFEVYF